MSDTKPLRLTYEDVDFLKSCGISTEGFLVITEIDSEGFLADIDTTIRERKADTLHGFSK